MVTQSAEYLANYGWFVVHAAWQPKTFRFPRRWSRRPTCSLLDHGLGWSAGVLWRFADSHRPVHATGSLHSFRTDGSGLLHGSCAKRLLARREPRRTRSSILFCLSLSCGCRRRLVECGSLRPGLAKRNGGLTARTWLNGGTWLCRQRSSQNARVRKHSNVPGPFDPFRFGKGLIWSNTVEVFQASTSGALIDRARFAPTTN